MTPEQKKLARHALGLSDDNKKSYRNRYAASVGSPQYFEWSMLVAQKKAEQSMTTPGHGLMMFHLTYQGAVEALEPDERLCTEDFPRAGVQVEW